jgi:chromate transporter
VQALWGLAKTAAKGPFLAAVGVAVLILYLLGFNELALLFGGGILVMLVRNLGRLGRGDGTAAALLPLGSISPLLFAQTTPVSLGQLFWSFLKIGAVLYGSGYVLLAFLRNEFVVRLDWLTALLAIVAAVLLFRFKLNSAWLVLGGGLIALLIRWLAPGLLP